MAAITNSSIKPGSLAMADQCGAIMDMALTPHQAKYFAHDLAGFGRNSRAMIENELNWHLIAEKWTRTTYLEVCPS